MILRSTASTGSRGTIDRAKDRNRVDLRPLGTAMALGTILPLAWLLRLYRIDFQSLWYDEGITAALVHRSLETITSDASRDIHPPLYYYLLHFWVSVAGSSEFALRMVSAMFGLATICLAYKLARALFGRLAALILCGILSVSPLMVNYSQEARMYMLVSFLATASSYLFVRIVLQGRDRWRLRACYVLVSAALLYSHYFAFTILLMQNIFILSFWLLAQIRRVQPSGNEHRQKLLADSHGPLGRWIAGQCLVVLLFIPWLLLSLRQVLGYPGQFTEILSLTGLAEGIFKVFVFGVGWDSSFTARRATAVLLVLAMVPLYFLVEGGRRRWRSMYFLILYCAVPIASMYLLSLQRPMYKERYLLVAAPALYLLPTLGIAGIISAFWRVSARLRQNQLRVLATALGALAVLGVLYPSVLGLRSYYSDPKYARDDYRGLSAYISDHARAGEAIILNAPGQAEIFDYYYRGDLQRIALPKQRPIDQSATGGDLNTITARVDGIWLVLWATTESDPNDFVESWLDQRGFKDLDRPFGTVRLLHFDLERTSFGSLPEGAPVTYHGGSA